MPELQPVIRITAISPPFQKRPTSQRYKHSKRAVLVQQGNATHFCQSSSYLRSWQRCLSKELLGIGRHCCGISVQKSVEPIQLPVQTFDKVLRLSGPRQIVILTRKENDLGC